MTRPRLRWTALVVAMPLVLLVVAGLQPESSHRAPPGADGDPTVARQMVDDRPDMDAAPAPDRVERRVRSAAGEQGFDPSPGPDRVERRERSEPGGEHDPGPEPDFTPASVTDEGYEVVGGTARAGAGERIAYTVEVDPIIDIDPLAVTAAVERALHDPRSWAADVELVRVDDPAEAGIRVVLAAPAEVDRLCAEAGLDTDGRFSCWNGRIAALNAMRWMRGAADFDDLDTYRTYLVNHEFGHGLGYGHVDCPGPGRGAPVMMQQTMSIGSCTANGWPYPERSTD